MTLCTERIRTLDDIRAFLHGNEAADRPRKRQPASGTTSGHVSDLSAPTRDWRGFSAAFRTGALGYVRSRARIHTRRPGRLPERGA